MTKVGEVIESSSAECIAQSYQLNEAPPLGSLVRVSREDGVITIFGVVAAIETRPLDPARKPIARGRNASTLQEIYDEHPQMRELFRTHFTFRILGHEANGALHHYLPPLPPEVHQLVYACEPEKLIAFTDRLTFLPVLLGGARDDETAAAFLRHAGVARSPDSHAFLVRAGKEMVNLLQGDAPRLSALLGRLK